MLGSNEKIKDVPTKVGTEFIKKEHIDMAFLDKSQDELNQEWKAISLRLKEFLTFSNVSQGKEVNFYDHPFIGKFPSDVNEILEQVESLLDMPTHIDEERQKESSLSR